jgi:hypothetical protein
MKVWAVDGGGMIDNKEHLRLIEQQRKVWTLIDKHKERWEELKTWLKKHPNQIHYMGAATVESVVKKMEELEDY